MKSMSARWDVASITEAIESKASGFLEESNVTTLKMYFFVSVPDRTSETLVKHISDYALPGSIICTDMWKGYGLLNSMGYEHQHVNHSVHFKNPETGVHTNTIEGTWNGLKMQIKPRNRTRKFIDSELVVAI